MSVPERDLDEPDEALCAEHGKPHPCRYCRFEHLMQRGEELRERRRDGEGEGEGRRSGIV